MNVTCPDCSSVFRVDPAKVPEPGVRARCSVCGGVLDVARVPAAGHEPAAATPPARDGAYATEITAYPTPRAEGSVTSPAVSGAASASAPPGEAQTSAVRDAGSAPPQLVSQPAPQATTELPADAGVGSRPARPFNPYLSNTPELRARRLARALVSDLVAYNPQKREEGLRDGTLRQLFREEIRKSWEEYVEQVGAHVAESTPHFQDALNDVLAGGRRVF